MSFITKRERVFNEYDLFDLPARNEGKLKAYASCTDARAWSHFGSDKTEHLVEVIKRNNETVRPKYIPTEIIVSTLMISKNAEIARLKRKIEEFEQLLAAYDQLDLTCDQKCDIANAHAAIKAANKELDEMCLDLDLSGFTEGIDSEAFETGKSRGDELRFTGKETGKSCGDEWNAHKQSTPRMESKSNQFGASCTCDASTSAYDTRIEELQGTIISKDAKLSAMQNTIAVMENDVCEPYCVYAHIYTALEKIFGTLCQNKKYKEYLELLTAGKDTRGIDIKGKILFKIKVLEKFSLALIAPCSQDQYNTANDCACYHAEIVTHVETTFALTSAESTHLNLDSKRAHLIADIMQNEDLKEILDKESLSNKMDDDQLDECCTFSYNIDQENLKRLKKLQSNYDDLLNCYDNLRYERDCLNTRCQKYDQLEKECECLQNKLREYNELWKEKEYYRNRSEDLDSLKEKFLILADETMNIETKLKAEQEINKVKSKTIDDLKNENIKLDNKLTEVSLVCEKQKNSLNCKLKEKECKIMCQEQQIKSLSIQIDNLLDKETNKISKENESRYLALIDEIESQKEQIKNLKDALCCNEEEKLYYKEEFEKQLEVINEIKFEIDDWKSKYEKEMQNNNYLKAYLEEYQIELSNIQRNNKVLSTELENKVSAIENLNDIIHKKSQKINDLIDEIDQKEEENKSLLNELKSIQGSFDQSINLFKNEKKAAVDSIRSIRQESLEMLQSIKSYTDIKEDISGQNCTKDINKTEDSDILKEIQLLREINLENIDILRRENKEIKKSFDLAQKQSEVLKINALNQEELLKKIDQLSQSHDSLIHENAILQHDLNNKTIEANKLLHAFELTNKKSENLMDRLHESETVQKECLKLSESYQKLIAERNDLQKKNLILEEVSQELNESQKIIKEQNKCLHSKEQQVSDLESALLDLRKKYDQLQKQNNILQRDYDEKYKELKKISTDLNNKIEETQNLTYNLNVLKSQNAIVADNLEKLKRENLSMQADLTVTKKESKEFIERLKHYENLETEYYSLEEAHRQINLENERLQQEIELKLENLKKLEQDNNNLNIQNKNLLIHNSDLEEALIRARNELLKSDSVTISYENIKAEIDILKSEKVTSHNKINDLQDKIYELDYHIHDLNENIIARDKKIMILENYNNNLKDEIKKLQRNLNDVVESGEEIRNLSYEKIDQTQKMLEAHHSKATHNMKIEVAKLKNEKNMLEEQISISKLVTQDSSNEKHIYTSLINELNEERNRIVSDIRQLELQIFEESDLNPSNSSAEKVIETLQKIGKYLYKNKSLEQILLSVQSSYQILKSKADEAKNIAERERQKIIDEKEDMQKERKNIEKQLEILKNKLEEDKAVYENNMKDLEGEMLNQTLLFDKMKQTQENEILKLKNDKRSLQELHETTLIQLKDLQDKLNNECKENSILQKAVVQATLDVKEKDKQILSLQNKPRKDYGMQTYSQTVKDIATETYNGKQEKAFISFEGYDHFESTPKASNHSNIKTEKNEYKALNIGLVKFIYSNYKSKKLSPGKLEHYSIDSINLLEKNMKEVSTNTLESPPFQKSNLALVTSCSVVKIYNTNKFIDSAKNTNDSDNYDSANKADSIKSSLITGLGLSNEAIISKNEFDDNIASDKSPYKADKDIFMIYKDSDTTFENRSYAENGLWPQKGYTNIIVERASMHTNKLYPFDTKTNETFDTKTNDMQKEDDTLESNNDNSDDDSLKPKLNINLPRVYTDNNSTVTTSEIDRKSLDSYTREIYVSPKRRIHSDTNISIATSKTKKISITSTIDNLRNGTKKQINLYGNIAPTIQNIEKESQFSLLSDKIKRNSKDTNIIEETTTKTHIIKTDSLLTEERDDNSNLTRINATSKILSNENSDLSSSDKTMKDNSTLKRITNNTGNIHVLQISKNSGSNKKLHKSHSDDTIYIGSLMNKFKDSDLHEIFSTECSTIPSTSKETKSLIDRAVSVKLDRTEEYKNQIQQLNKALENLERDYKNKIDAVKVQYDSNVKRIINKHNQGVESIQSLHEERLYDIINTHEIEIESLRTMGIEALRKVERLENENHYLKCKLGRQDSNLDEVPVKISTPEIKKRRIKSRLDDKTLTKTGVVISNLPKRRSQGPCTCTIDFNVSDTIRHIFDQVDTEQRKMAEQTYLKYIANKILSDNVEVLDAQELSFLHLKVCRQWKSKLNKEETLQKRIESLESELINKQRQTHQHMAELDRRVAEEWQRLQEVRETVCCSPKHSDENVLKPIFIPTLSDKDVVNVNSVSCNIAFGERHGRSLEIEAPNIRKPKRIRESNRAVSAKLNVEERRQKTPYNEEAPTKLKRTHDRRLHRK